MAAVRAARSANVFIIFVVLDNPNSRVSEEECDLFYFVNRRTQSVTEPWCCAAGLHPGHQGAHIQRAGRAARDPLLHGRVPLPLLRHPARCQRLAGDPERRAQTVV